MPISKQTKYAMAWQIFGLLPVGRRGKPCSPDLGTLGESRSTPKRIGVFAQWGIGDAVLAMPLLMGLRARFPEASLELLGKGWLDDLFKDTGLCDVAHRLVPPWTKYSGKYKVWDSDWRRFARELRTVGGVPFDWLVSVRHDPREILQLRALNATFKAGYGGGRSKGLDFDMGVPPHLATMAHVMEDAAEASRLLTGGCPEPRPIFRVSSENRANILGRVVAQGYRTGLIVAVSWGAGAPIRRWDGSKFQEVIGKLGGRVGFIAVIDEPGQPRAPIELPNHIPAARWECSLADLKALLSITDLTIASDSGVMHIASACGSRVVAIFGPTSPQWYGPHRPDDHVERVEPMPCRPCFDACIHDRPICMDGVSSRQVSLAVHETIGRIERPRAAGSI